MIACVLVARSARGGLEGRPAVRQSRHELATTPMPLRVRVPHSETDCRQPENPSLTFKHSERLPVYLPFKQAGRNLDLGTDHPGRRGSNPFTERLNDPDGGRGGVLVQQVPQGTYGTRGSRGAYCTTGRQHTGPYRGVGVKKVATRTEPGQAPKSRGATWVAYCPLWWPTTTYGGATETPQHLVVEASTTTYGGVRPGPHKGCPKGAARIGQTGLDRVCSPFKHTAPGDSRSPVILYYSDLFRLGRKHWFRLRRIVSRFDQCFRGSTRDRHPEIVLSSQTNRLAICPSSPHE